MPLSMVGIGEVKLVCKVLGQDEMHRHLETLGFVPGAEVVVVSELDGNLIVNIKDSRIAVNKDIATKILVL